ncbi:MAG: hypothetical protein M0R46_11930 [Candidatus Muirbacterium halophilum]|nr:hypothetical protein [Candidatus Muirbacterium halophilum]MCK9476624.1 hypothetical protein [Candidatus Muirbacterium halophilum]
MKKIICLIILICFIFTGCKSKKIQEKPISLQNKEINIINRKFTTPMQTYDENLKLKLTNSNNQDDFKNIILQALNVIPANNREKPDIEKVKKAIEIISEEQRTNSNPYNQLILYKLKSYLFYLKGDKNSEQAEKINFTELYNRIMNLN